MIFKTRKESPATNRPLVSSIAQHQIQKRGMVYKLKNIVKVSVAVAFLSFLYSCQRSETTQSQGETVTETDTSDTLASTHQLPYQLKYNPESENFDLEKNAGFEEKGLEEVLNALDSKYPEIPLLVEKEQQDTLYVNIPMSNYLTQSMGSTGATIFLIEATYAFTSVPPFQVVHYSFQKGDHAVPGYYSRESFTEFFAPVHQRDSLAQETDTKE